MSQNRQKKTKECLCLCLGIKAYLGKRCSVVLNQAFQSKVKVIYGAELKV